MSRKGRTPIAVPSGVEVTVNDGVVGVKGPKGRLEMPIIKGVTITVDNGEISVTVPEKNERAMRKFQGLTRALVDNMVIGVTKGFEKTLDMIGVGYRAAVKGNDLDLQLGFSHPTALPIPEGIEVKVEKNTRVTISGMDKRAVGEFAACVRRVRPPEPYKGKGVRYTDEYVRRKAGKAAGKK